MPRPRVLRQGTVHLQEGVLHRIRSLIRILEDAAGQSVQPWTVVLDQVSEGIFVTPKAFGHQCVVVHHNPDGTTRGRERPHVGHKWPGRAGRLRT